jgi:hypothetical protein
MATKQWGQVCFSEQNNGVRFVFLVGKSQSRGFHFPWRLLKWVTEKFNLTPFARALLPELDPFCPSFAGPAGHRDHAGSDSLVFTA